MPQHGDELLAQLGILALDGERGVAAHKIRRRLGDARLQRRSQGFQLIARFAKLPLIAAPVGGVEDRHADEHGLAVGRLALGSIDQHR